MTVTNLGLLIRRMLRASRLDKRHYDEVRADPCATVHGLGILVVSSLLGLVGNGLTELFGTYPDRTSWPLTVQLLVSVVSWCWLVNVTHFIGTRVFGGRATHSQVLRTQAFANSPACLWVLTFLPSVGELLTNLIIVWMLTTQFVAIRQGLQFSTVRALGTQVGLWASILLAILIWVLVFGTEGQ